MDDDKTAPVIRTNESNDMYIRINHWSHVFIWMDRNEHVGSVKLSTNAPIRSHSFRKTSKTNSQFQLMIMPCKYSPFFLLNLTKIMAINKHTEIALGNHIDRSGLVKVHCMPLASALQRNAVVQFSLNWLVYYFFFQWIFQSVFLLF